MENEKEDIFKAILKLSKCRLGLLVNFNVKYLKNGIKRVIL
ncbi:MAG: GxxExxY protein [Mangrovibacterium sp.]